MIFLRIILICLLITSCLGRKSGRSVASLSLGEELKPSGSLTAEEHSLAYNVCMALRSKNISLRAEKNGKKFSFDLTHQNCQGENKTTTLDTVLNVISDKQPMEWKSSQSKYFKYVETHEFGIMSGVCNEILQGKGGNNTYMLDNTSKVQLRFSVINNQIVRVTANTARVNSSQGDLIYKIDEIEFLVEQGSIAGINGIEKSHTQSIPCANGGHEKLTQRIK